MVLEFRLTNIKTTRDVGRMTIAAPAIWIIGCRPVYPCTTHRVVDSRKYLHRHLMRIISCELAIDV
jgi:hypothetical protein